MVLLITGCVARKPTLSPSIQPPPIHNGEVRDSLLTGLLDQYPQYFDSLLRQNDRWHIQIIYTQIDRRPNNQPVFTEHRFQADPDQYFYPASTVKMPIAFLALQRLNELKIAGLDKDATMITGSSTPAQQPVYNDPTAEDGRPTIAHYIRKIFLASDNDAFNRLYEFLGQAYINESLHRMGYDSVQVIHRLNISLSEEENRRTNPIQFFNAGGRLLYEQPAVRSELPYQQRHTLLGNGYYRGRELVHAPFDFSRKNRFALADLHSVLRSVIFPEATADRQRFHLSADDYRFLYRSMSMVPRESRYPSFDTSYGDAYVKFLFFGARDSVGPDIRSFNKPGDAYGFLTDVAYIVDFKNGIEFLLSATIACNSDNIFNDDRYDYQNVGLPFMRNLGRVIYAYELKRKREVAPDLSKFRFDYTN